ncbi:hypothetical protein [Amycolatopsis sp. RTGN1]|uniref:hypothetical protein n=1 Tax=Amycolatopsis ponsaeliensis TaxID=2992142 RepID=UPI0025503E43|nr:hypothetical protein [Amycolatopsis sp. RTGN1]
MATLRNLPMPIVAGAISGGAMLLAVAVQAVAPAWAVGGIAALLGVAAGLVVTALIRDRDGRREHAAEDAYAALPSYRAVTGAALDLVALPVWPSDHRRLAEDKSNGNPDTLAQPTVDAVRHLDFRPPPVRQAADAVLTTARDLAHVVADIRTTTKPGHRGAIAARVANRHETAVAALRDAHNQFVAVCRVDLGADRKLALLRPGFLRRTSRRAEAAGAQLR